MKVRCTIEDSGRSQLTQLFDAYTLALEAGADRICYSDTVGQLDPEKVSKTIAGLREKFPFVDIEVHFHNDRGLALANALAAIKAGANWVSTSVNGLGERCGIVDLSLLYANLIYIGKKRVKNPSLLHRLSETVAAYSRTTVSQMAPVVGLSAFSHTAKLHRNAVLENEAAYSWICPSSLGRRVTLQNVEGNPRTEELVSSPRIITATELKHHRHGPGDRYVMIDERFVPNCRQYCIVREVPDMEDYGAGHVDSHAHKVDSLYMFIGKETN